MSLSTFSGWLSATPVSLFIQEVAWIVPTVQTIHILGIAGVIGAILLVNLRILGVAMPGQPVAAVAQRFLPSVWVTAGILLLSGAILILGEPGRSLPNPTFQLKMGLLLAVLTLTAVLQRGLRRDPLFWESTPLRHTQALVIATASLVLWVGIVFAGRWIAYS